MAVTPSGNQPAITWHYRLAQGVAGLLAVLFVLGLAYGVGFYLSLLIRTFLIGWHLGWGMWGV